MPQRAAITITGACQHNLKNLDLRLPLNELIVVTGVSGSGKSSLAFDTLYAEGQRRYVETFSPYARQFLERMDKPRVDRIDGIPPAIAVDQVNPVRTSRSTVGTMTEINDRLKLLFARAAVLICPDCNQSVQRETPQTIADAIDRAIDAGAPGDGPDRDRLAIGFSTRVPANFSETEIRDWLGRQGYTRVERRAGEILDVTLDRFSLKQRSRSRLVDDIEQALKHGHGKIWARLATELRFSQGLHCADCNRDFREPTANLFSFNAPVGACEICRGFGRTIGLDLGQVIPSPDRTLAEGAVKPWQSDSYRECQDDLLRFARRRGIPADIPWHALPDAARQWVIEGEGEWDDGKWYGIRRFFDWLESKSYRMHIRVLLSRYRAYSPCPACHGARLKPEALMWRLGNERLSIHDLMLLPVTDCRAFFRDMQPAGADEATAILMSEIRNRLDYLVDVGLGYLALDRQSRTLSGGEVQRINLTTALGAALVNTLFVLDEPSIGLHPRDIRRLIAILHRLRDAGNSLVVVEHDPDVIRAADRVLDLGPGPGEKGGEIVCFDTPRMLQRNRHSLTARYLSGRETIRRHAGAVTGAQALPETAAPAATLVIRGAAEHNLKGIDVSIPLRRLVCLTGVSGSGKSTLMRDILYYGLRRLQHRPVDTPGRHERISGHDRISDVVMVDQSTIGKTTRSNPVIYVGAFDVIRKAFAAAPTAVARGYNAGTFSFNSRAGRCPECEGRGFERVEMQFLSDVYMRCSECNGRRYRADILDVSMTPAAAATAAGQPAVGRSIADVLDMSADEATVFFADRPEIGVALAPLRKVGLGYLRLGQPVPTLSGGEAQRLKLAGYLAGSFVRQSVAARRSANGILFLLDEPTTGLHFSDIAVLLTAFDELLAHGHSVIVIEHQLDVIRNADWIIDLGPEGGAQGGRLVCQGTPAQVAKHPDSHTGRVLREAMQRLEKKASSPSVADRRTVKHARAKRPAAARRIEILHAREHNLKNLSLQIPRDRLTVITGVSGSGKSTVAFDILFAEGQRRYLESLNAYARQFVQPAARPDVDAVRGMPPTIAIEQRTSRGGRKSTVATVTEIHHFLRLLFVKLGQPYCPDCKVPIRARTRDLIADRLQRDFAGKSLTLFAPLVTARKGYYTDLARWAVRQGFDQLLVDGVMTPTDNWPRLQRFHEHNIELPVATGRVGRHAADWLGPALDQALHYGGGALVARGKASGPGSVYSIRRACPDCGRGFRPIDPRLFSYNSKHGWCPACFGTGLRMRGFDADQTGEEIWWNEWWEGVAPVCPVCRGQRLCPEALAIRFRDRSIADYSGMTVVAAHRFFKQLRLRGRDAIIACDVLPEILARLEFLAEVGLSYLALDRSAPTLSGGEARRIRLASQLGSNLRGVCYILDEPTIGLHARDNRMLLDTLVRLRDQGNTVIVVEHDEDTIRRADHVVDLGPGAGRHGGRVVAQGTPLALARNRRSITGQSLRKPMPHPLPRAAVAPAKPSAGKSATLEVIGATLHNLKNINVTIPLGGMVCVTGVSGSGKSTLVRDILYENIRQSLQRPARNRRPREDTRRGCREIRGMENVCRILEVDQKPIGKTPRSCPATYVGFWDAVRRLFAATPEARVRGYTAGRFSFNIRGGRCDACNGQGQRTVEMSFLPNVNVPCEGCNGRRFNPETLAVEYRGRSIADVLALTVEDAIVIFEAQPLVRRPLELLRDVGLEYLTLGQPSPTLSGGEAQRLKLVTELARISENRERGGGSLYMLDEPTIGLHMADVTKLLVVLRRLVTAGNTVIVIEHNLDVIAEADWILDLGPEGGDQGGRLVAKGPPAKVVAMQPKRSHTARLLAEFLARQHAVDTQGINA